MVAGGAFANDGISPQFKDAGHCRVFRYDSTAEWWNKMGQDLVSVMAAKKKRAIL